MDITTREEIRDITQFVHANFPFNYLGVLLSSRRLSIGDCEQLADKMTTLIRAWQAKHMTYAARLQIFNSVLMGISSYWRQIFIILKRLINIVNSICRALLW